MLNFKVSPYKKMIWIMLAFFIKMLVSCYLFYIKTDPNVDINTFSFTAGDSFTYFDSIENLIKSGSYKPFYRMPGIGFPYYLLRLIFDKHLSLNLLILMQILYASLACYLLARLAYQLSHSILFFYITFFLGVINSYYGVYDIWLLSESICTSSLIFSVYFFYQALVFSINRYKSIFISGIFITWAVFSRPIYAPLLILYILFILFYFYKINKVSLIKLIIVFSIPFILLDSIWVYHGYKHKHKIVFLQHSSANLGEESQEAYKWDELLLSLVNYVQTFGGDLVWWNPEAEISWFGVVKGSSENYVKQLPKYAFTSYCNEDSLLIVKKNISIIYDTITSQPIKDSIRQETIKMLNRFTKSYIEMKPFHYHISSRLIILKKFILHQPTYNLYFKQFSDLKWYHRLVKLFYFFMYYLYITGFFLSFFFLCFNKKRNLYLPVVSVALFGVFIYPFLRFCEYRYIVPVIPFILFLSSFSIYSIVTFLKKN